MLKNFRKNVLKCEINIYLFIFDITIIIINNYSSKEKWTLDNQLTILSKISWFVSGEQSNYLPKPRAEAYTVEPPGKGSPKMSSLDGRLGEFRPYWVKIYLSLKYGNCRDLTLAPMPIQFFYSCSVDFEEKFDSSDLYISAFCTSKEHDNVTTPNYPVFALLSVKWSLTRG